MSFQFTYQKPAIAKLVQQLTDQQIGFEDGQLYSPINEVFLELNNTNSQSTTFNYPSIVNEVKQIHNGNELTLSCTSNNGSNSAMSEKEAFVKYSPLLDPVRYLVGKYDIENANLTMLPKFQSEEPNAKIRDYDNASYVDGFFSYLSSQLLHQHGFLNALDCYGTLIGKKREFFFNAYDDIEYLTDSEFFFKQQNKLYEMSESGQQLIEEMQGQDSRSKKRRLEVSEKNIAADLVCDDMGDFYDTKLPSVPQDSDSESDSDTDSEAERLAEAYEMHPKVALGELTEANLETLGLTGVQDSTDTARKEDKPDREANGGGCGEGGDGGCCGCDCACDMEARDAAQKPCAKSLSQHSQTCSSRSSNTQSDSECESHVSGSGSRKSGRSGSDSDSGSETSTSSGSSDSTQVCGLTIYNFPSQAIFLEKCENTLDDLCANDEDFGTEELGAALLQVVMTLMAYKKCFDFQHNDLHTNNIMFIPTKKQYLYYKVNNTHYRVPTFGRIFKIIDFGRATYKFRGKQLCSDSFHKDGDAHSQFNFGRHYNPNRPVLQPNDSFDLCRLGTSLIDFLIDEDEDPEEIKDPIIRMVMEWCEDDKGRNVLWKSNGEERYPGFKLYKMIARTVSKHTPVAQLERPILEQYKCSRKSIKRDAKIINIDNLPSYV